jgi:hypothetical protein
VHFVRQIAKPRSLVDVSRRHDVNEPWEYEREAAKDLVAALKKQILRDCELAREELQKLL